MEVVLRSSTERVEHESIMIRANKGQRERRNVDTYTQLFSRRCPYCLTKLCHRERVPCISLHDRVAEYDRGEFPVCLINDEPAER